MVPVLGREVEEGEQSFPVLGQAGDRLVVLGAVLVGEHIDGRVGCRAGRRTVNFTKVGLHVDLDREGNFVQDVGGLVNPTPLMPGARKDLLDGLPEAERAPRFSRGQARRPPGPGAISSPSCLMSMRSSRQLCALSRTPVWKPTNSFLPSGVAPISTSMHSAAGSIRACKETPSAHTYTYRRAESSRFCQAS